ncbi:MAG: 50S ribosomal protein L15 [Ignavibacteriaceae bacterium]|jgi:LSU ribosomal protein L15P|nr:MAG: 50S ribosomal protein L15 [Chlorobiota bacterium]KXK06160.1 MAG: 50S ribosomal protein L15 [Chlorobi bacterium OLB4]MBV6398588.1 50S ribosomal protein L15 [Ignavibacteria bacterium]MCC6885823.1 50S ribosomal protein L15 [Ignavibacteriales bacterium]MCE7952982.1 50S ribosomal protein L15 [Chlorobi bacterium CHB7]MDL1887180.1 50S ribosomal protein L15 [Ignavibacteria bacterium CHB1]MEB2329234.1 50S ribosomal protein L15 [Ignavibacteriaceae bacterium]OQY78073.1 MAG: 50S ribosomal protei
MDILSNLTYSAGSKRKKKRVGRGQGSGHGGTSTRGHKGQHSRSGAKFRAWFEGGQMPLQRRVPKFGFKNFNRREYVVINLGEIQKSIESGKITDKVLNKEILFNSKLISSKRTLLKVLGNGNITNAIEISANAFSKTALEKIEKAGGKATII